jgi:acetyl-CoA acetyltransferase family protein
MKLNLAILSARRTPVGTYLGSLKNMTPTQMGVLSAKAALEDSGVALENFSHSIFGNVCSFSAPDGVYLSRHIGLKAGLPQSAGSLTVNRLCGSGFEALMQASFYVNQGPVLAGGAESMSLAPLILRGVREGFKFAKPPASVDSLWESLTDLHAGMAMGETAELLAKEYEISRDECDRWALQSHQRAAAEEDSGFTRQFEMISIELPKSQKLERDEHIRRDSNAEKLAKLQPVFGGVTTAANASGMNDAAAALVLADANNLPKGAKPMARIIGAVAVGCDPQRMGIGPVSAIQKLNQELGWDLSSIDYVEVNEAFAAQVLAVKKALKLSDSQLNPHGSGISLGHPLGATGARIACHISHLINQGRVKRAIGSACIGGGQGIAVAFEKFSD